MALIITGHQRSGTTLLLQLCNSHPEIYLTGEFGNFYHLGEPYPAYARFILRRWVEKRNASFQNEKKRPLKGANMVSNLRFVLAYLYRLRRHTRAAVGVPQVEAALCDLFSPHRIVGDKYPDYAFHLKQFSRSPGIRTLFIYRDPRDVASSSVQRARTNWQTTWPAELRDPRTIARRWVQLIEQTERFPQNLLPLCYEALVTQPRAVMDTVAAWLEVDPAGFRTEMVRVDRIGKHATGLTPQETQDVIQIAGPTMERMGYQI